VRRLDQQEFKAALGADAGFQCDPRM
jgi:hypothetical protein